LIQHPLTPPFNVDTSRRPLPRWGEGAITATARAASAHEAPPGRWRTFISRCQTAHISSFPRRVFAPGFVSCLSHPTPKPRGGRSAGRRALVFSSRLRGATAALATRGASRCDRDGAPRRSTVAIFGRGTRAAISGSAAGSDQHLARAQAMRPGGRDPEPPEPRFAPQPRDATPPLRLQDRL
jgi:hypothetical protein